MSKKTSTKNISQVNQQGESSSLGGGMGKNIVMNVGTILHNNIMSLNNSKYFAGIVMILLNVGSKFVPMRKFRSFDGVSADDKNVNEIQKSILGLVSVGILFFVIGYSYSKGKEKA